MRSLVIDTENTIFQKGNPFSRRNKCAAVALKKDDHPAQCIKVEYDEPVSHGTLKFIEDVKDQADLLIGFNLKYDLHWLRRYGLEISSKVFCTQLAQFIIENQQRRYPSLEDSCAYWGITGKKNSIKEDYWDQGIDNTEVPWPVLHERGTSDAEITYQLYLKQTEYLRAHPKLEKLVELANIDLLVLREMEWNGLKFNMAKAKEREEQLNGEIQRIDNSLRENLGDYNFNFNSGDHLSCILYGGTIVFRERAPYLHRYKTGVKKGTTQMKSVIVEHEVTMPRLINPVEGSELKKTGYFSTAAPVLAKLRPKGQSKEVIGLLKRRAELEQLVSTYYHGFPAKMLEMNWEPNEIHSQLNQCVAITGRLSSSGPNQQNIPPEVYALVETRYDNLTH